MEPGSPHEVQQHGLSLVSLMVRQRDEIGFPPLRDLTNGKISLSPESFLVTYPVVVSNSAGVEALHINWHLQVSSNTADSFGCVG